MSGIPNHSALTTASQAVIIKVAIVEDRREIREALSMLINGTDGFRCTGFYRTMEEALDRMGRDLPTSRFATSACRG